MLFLEKKMGQLFKNGFLAELCLLSEKGFSQNWFKILQGSFREIFSFETSVKRLIYRILIEFFKLLIWKLSSKIPDEHLATTIFSEYIESWYILQTLCESFWPLFQKPKFTFPGEKLVTKILWRKRLELLILPLSDGTFGTRLFETHFLSRGTFLIETLPDNNF